MLATEQIQDTHPHACNGAGLVLMGLMVWDEDAGEEVDYVEALPCRRCMEEREEAEKLLNTQHVAYLSMGE